MIAISYRREDSLPVAGRLYDRLQSEFGKQEVFMDFDSIPPGVDFREKIRETIGQSDVVIALIGPRWLGPQGEGIRRIDTATDFVRLEIAYALELKIPIIPVLVNHTRMPEPQELPENIRDLAYRNAVSLDTGIDFHHHADRLIRGIAQAATPRPVEKATPIKEPNQKVPDESRKKLLIWSSVIVLGVAVITALFLTNRRPQLSRAEMTSSPTSTPSLSPEKSGTASPVAVRSSAPVPSPTEKPIPEATTAPSPSTASAAVTVAPVASSTPALPPAASPAPSRSGLNFATITKENPYTNSLGMKFIPVAAAKPLFSIWDTRVQDYQAFVNETHHHWIKPGFQQSETHPAVNVSWADAQEFCQWLTDRERRAGKLSDQQQYRLPTDAEWSAAAGPTKFPWGNQWPPPARAGNYSPSLNVDEYKFTSPTGTFPPNAAGLYDMGGNVWQWCQDWFREEMNSSEGTAAHPDPKNGRRNTGERVVRGGSYYVGSGFSNVNSARRYIETSTRIGGGSPNTRNANNGFRCVLADSANTATDATKQAGVQ